MLCPDISSQVIWPISFRWSDFELGFLLNGLGLSLCASNLQGNPGCVHGLELLPGGADPVGTCDVVLKEGILGILPIIRRVDHFRVDELERALRMGEVIAEDLACGLLRSLELPGVPG